MPYLLLEHGADAMIANNRGVRPIDMAAKPTKGEPGTDLICKMLLPTEALVQLAMDVVEAHEKRLKRIVKGLKRAVESQGFRSDLADMLAGIDASGCAWGTGAMLKSLLRQLDAFAKGAGDGAAEALRAPRRHGLGEAYEERRGRHGLAVLEAVKSADFLSELAEGLAGVNMYESDPGAPKKLVAAAEKVDAIEVAEERLKRIKAGLERAVQSAGFRTDLADTLAGVDASGCAPGTGAILKSVLRQLYAFARGEDAMDAQGGVRAPKFLADAYRERRQRHRRAVVRAVQSSDFLGELAEGLAGLNMLDPRLVAAAARLDALSEEGGGGGPAPKRARRGRA